MGEDGAGEPAGTAEGDAVGVEEGRAQDGADDDAVVEQRPHVPDVPDVPNRSQDRQSTRSAAGTSPTFAYLVVSLYTTHEHTTHKDAAMKKSKPVPNYTETVSVRLTVAEAQRLYDIANDGRRTLSQTLRLLLEPALHMPQQGT